MLPGNWAPSVQNDIFGIHMPPLLWRGTANLTAGDVVAFSWDFAPNALQNPQATAGITNGNRDHVLGNVLPMTAANTQLSWLAVATTNVTAGAGVGANFCIWSPDIPVKIQQGTGATPAVGDYLCATTNAATGFAITAGQLFTQSLAKILLGTVACKQYVYGRALEVSGASAAVKRCLFDGTGLFTIGTVG